MIAIASPATPTLPAPAKQRLKLWLLITLSCVALGPPFGAIWYSIIAVLTQPSGFIIIIFAVPYSYIIGGIPALLGGGAYALCVSAWGDRVRFVWWLRMLLGILLGGMACLLFLIFVPLFKDGGDLLGTTLYIGCGMFAGLLCAWRYRLRWIDARLRTPEA